MSVQEMIDNLQAIEDKTAPVYYLDSYYLVVEIERVEVEKLTDGTTEVILKPR